MPIAMETKLCSSYYTNLFIMVVVIEVVVMIVVGLYEEFSIYFHYITSVTLMDSVLLTPRIIY